jgi:RimJ/RimL family protein N-acetyltransferase
VIASRYRADMDASGPRLVAEQLTTARLILEPLRPEHAAEAHPVFDDQRLHTFTGGSPATLDELRARYTRQAVGRSADGSQDWLNWMLRERETGAVVGTVQATIQYFDALSAPEAEIAWAIGTGQQGRGLATEAASAMVSWLRQHGVPMFIAHVHPDHLASARVAEHLGLIATTTMVEGELRWISPIS